MVQRVKRCLRASHRKSPLRVGAAGILDPAVPGVLPVLIGAASSLADALPPVKVYAATVRLGKRTTTADLHGEALPLANASSASTLSAAQIQAALHARVGHSLQVPPAVSNVRVRSLDLVQRMAPGARRAREAAAARHAQSLIDSIEAALTPKPIHIFEATVPARAGQWMSSEVMPSKPRPGAELDVPVLVSGEPGLYVRALARDVGADLQVGGCLAGLVRLAGSGVLASECVPLELVRTSADVIQHAMPIDACVLGYAPILVPAPCDLSQWLDAAGHLPDQPQLDGQPSPDTAVLQAAQACTAGWKVGKCVRIPASGLAPESCVHSSMPAQGTRMTRGFPAVGPMDDWRTWQGHTAAYSISDAAAASIARRLAGKPGSASTNTATSNSSQHLVPGQLLRVHADLSAIVPMVPQLQARACNWAALHAQLTTSAAWTSQWFQPSLRPLLAIVRVQRVDHAAGQVYAEVAAKVPQATFGLTRDLPPGCRGNAWLHAVATCWANPNRE